MAPRETLSVVRIGTRGGDLASWQAAEVARLIGRHHPAVNVEQQVIRTTGDLVLDTPLAQIEEKGLFTQELEEALANGSIDMAVHSLKDLPTRVPDGLALSAVLERGDPRDALVAAQARVPDPVAYCTRAVRPAGLPEVLSHLHAGRVDAVTFLSPSSAENLAAVMEDGTLSLLAGRTIVASVGPTTSAALTRLGAAPIVEATDRTAHGLAAALLSCFDPHRGAA